METTQRLDIQEVRSKNSDQLSIAIDQAGQSVVDQLDFTNDKDVYQHVAPVTIIDMQGQAIPCDLLVVLLKVPTTTHTQIANRELGIILAKKNTLKTLEYTIPLSRISNTLVGNVRSELAVRTWELISDSERMTILSTVNTKPYMESLGLGSTLLRAGEIIKTELAYKIANHWGILIIDSYIVDASKGWTKRHVGDLEGYGMIEEEETAYLKREQSPFISKNRVNS